MLLGVEEGEAFEVRTCDKKESVKSKCEKCLGMRNREIMRDGVLFQARGRRGRERARGWIWP